MSESGFDLLRQSLATAKSYQELSVELEPLEPLLETKHEPKYVEGEAQQEQLRAGLLQLLTTLTPDERRAKLCALDSETLDCLAEAIEENQAEAILATKNANKVLAVGTLTRLLRNLKTAVEHSVDYDDRYLRVMLLRSKAAFRRKPLPGRQVARELAVDEKTIRRWDKRAKALNVSLGNWSFETLQQVTKPGKRAPPS